MDQRTKLFTFAAAGMMFGACSVARGAAIFTESTDAGQLLPTATPLPAGIDRIHGALNPEGDIDLYRFILGTDTTFNVSILTPAGPGGIGFDTDTTIFDAQGHPLAVFDPPSFSLPLSAGAYYLAIADWNVAATNAAGQMIADDYYNIFIPEAVLGGWVATSSPERGGPYEITFSAVTIPEPAPALLMAAPAFLAMRRKRSRQIA